MRETTYNSRMKPRPQFSLRMLMIVTTLVCLAAAAAAPIPRPPGRPVLGGGVGWSWNDMGYAIHSQALLRAGVCAVFPAAAIAGASARDGALRAFCLGALFPTLLAPALLLLEAAESAWYLVADGRLTDAANSLGMQSAAFKDRITALWLCAPFNGLACALYGWWLRRGRGAAAQDARSSAARCLAGATVATALAALMVHLPGPDTQGGLFARIPLRLALCTFVPGALFVGAVEGRRRFRIFSAGAASFILMPQTFLWHHWMSHFDGQLEPSWLFQSRRSIVSIWALALWFGGMCVFLHWLFQHGEPEAKHE